MKLRNLAWNRLWDQIEARTWTLSVVWYWIGSRVDKRVWSRIVPGLSSYAQQQEAEGEQQP